MSSRSVGVYELRGGKAFLLFTDFAWPWLVLEVESGVHCERYVEAAALHGLAFSMARMEMKAKGRCTVGRPLVL